MRGNSFQGKRVVLTGASSGIGWYLATQLVQAGANVVVTSRRAERLRQLRLATGNPLKRLIAVPGDITDADHRQHVIDTAAEQLGGIDILINNAGIGAIGRFDQASPDRLRRIFDVDFFAAAEMTRLALPWLKEGREPAVCVVSSVLAHRGVPEKSEYCAAKFALRGWAESLRIELRGDGIAVVTVSPSTTRSEFFESLIDSPRDARSFSFGCQSAQQVAGKVLRAIRRRKREVVLSPGGKALVWLSRLAPGFTERLILANY
ncbi:MAG: glucose dehydrogenase [Pirellulaceae bacterium]|nr:MAG: glucose dehydrogenase [Pirellulaceae bacterium]